MTQEEKKVVSQLGSERFYPLEDGTWLPSVTTILSACYPKSRFLIDWQIEQGKEEAERILKEAAEEGQIIHSYIEHLLNGAILNVEPMSEKQRRCVSNFLAWANKTEFTPLATESQVYCKPLGYAGTIDILAKIDGEVWIVDIKTSNAIHASYDAQVAAYAYAYALEHKTSVKAAILHINARTKQGYTWHEVDLEQGFKVFNLTRQLFYALHPDPQPKIIEYPLTFEYGQSKKGAVLPQQN